MTTLLRFLLLLTLTIVGAGTMDVHAEVRREDRDKLSDATAKPFCQKEALLSDALNLYRINCTRSQRLTPTNGQKPPRTPGKLMYLQLVRNPLKVFFGSISQPVKTSVRRCVSRYYYVIALRHILR